MTLSSAALSSSQVWRKGAAIPRLLRQMLPHVVCLYMFVCLSYSCTLLKPLDGMRCHLAGTLVWSEVTLLDTPRKGETCGFGTPSSQRCQPVARLFRPLISSKTSLSVIQNFTAEHIATTIAATVSSSVQLLFTILDFLHHIGFNCCHERNYF